MQFFKKRVLVFMIFAWFFAYSGHATDFLYTGAWRFGNEKLNVSQDGLELTKRIPEATLSGTALNPGNLNTFRMTLEWNFGDGESRELRIGWGKPFEWDAFSQCSGYLVIKADGQAEVYAGDKKIGSLKIPVKAGGNTVTLIRKPGAIGLSVEGEERFFPLPSGSSEAIGYLTMRAEGFEKNGTSLRVKRIDIESSESVSSLSEEERNKKIQDWARGQLAKNLNVLERFEEYTREETAAGRWGYKTGLTVSPGLVKPGEEVRIEFRVNGPVPDDSKATVEPDFLDAQPGAHENLTLQWEPGENGSHVARVQLAPRKAGNWRIIWKVGNEQLIRVFAVVEPGYLAVRLLFTNYKGPWTPGHLPGAYDVAHDFGLSSDYWSGDEWASPFGRTPEALLARFGFFSRNKHLWGDRVMPMVNANWLFPGCIDANLWQFGDDVQREGIGQISRLWDILGLGPMEVMATYTLGHRTPRIAREAGIKVLDSFCQWQNWRDGGSNNSWLINHVGPPALPYYMADDDFRKIAQGISILGFPQNTNSNVRLYDIMTAEGQPQLNFRRTHGKEMAESSNTDRFETTVDLWLKEALYQAEPLFVSVGLENFIDSPDWDEANKRGVRYLREQALNHKLVFTSSADVAGYFERHYPLQPENWMVWPDIYAGQAGQYKPRQLPDRIEVSNQQFHTVHEDGQALPEFFWDYTGPWNEPVWNDQKEIRLKYGLADPELLTAGNSVPRMVSLEGVRARVETKFQNGEIELAVTVYTPKPMSFLPVAAWNLPLKPDDATGTYASENARFIRVVDGSTGNMHGIVVCNNLPAGTSNLNIRLKGTDRKVVNPDLSVNDCVKGRMFMHGEVPRAYLWLADTGISQGVLRVRVPEGRKVNVHYNDGRVEEAQGGTLLITFDRTWQRESPMVTGLSAAEIQSLSSFESL